MTELIMSDKKRFITECALFIRGDIKDVKLAGDRKTVGALAEVLSESRKLYCELEEGKNISVVLAQVEKKRSAAKKLKNITGFVWPF